MKDKQAGWRIDARIQAIATQEKLIGDYKNVGEGVIELRFNIGPGYRVYCLLNGTTLLLLLKGGTKRRQQADIMKAKQLAQEWKNDHGNT